MAERVFSAGKVAAVGERIGSATVVVVELENYSGVGTSVADAGKMEERIPSYGQ